MSGNSRRERRPAMFQRVNIIRDIQTECDTVFARFCTDLDEYMAER
jgi:hypothetical protein